MKKILLFAAMALNVALSAQLSVVNFTTITSIPTNTNLILSSIVTETVGNKIYVNGLACSTCSNSLIYESTNDGLSFTPSATYTTNIQYSCVKLNNGFYQNNAIYNSANGTWTNVPTFSIVSGAVSGQNKYGPRKYIKIDNNNALAFSTSTVAGLFHKTSNGGTSWTTGTSSNTISVRTILTGTLSNLVNIVQKLDDVARLADGSLVGVINARAKAYTDSTTIVTSLDNAVTWNKVAVINGNINGIWGSSINDINYFNSLTISTNTLNNSFVRQIQLYNTTNQFASSTTIAVNIDGLLLSAQNFTTQLNSYSNYTFGQSNYSQFQMPLVQNNKLIIFTNQAPIGVNAGLPSLLVADLAPIVTNIKQNNNYNFGIYPNPVTNELTINGNGNFTYKIINLTGAIMQSGQGNTVNVNNLIAGVYFIQVSNGNTVSTQKFIKH